PFNEIGMGNEPYAGAGTRKFPKIAATLPGATAAPKPASLTTPPGFTWRPLCVMVRLAPETVICAERGGPGLAATVNVTVAVALPVVGPERESQEGRPETVHGQPVLVWICMVKVPPAAVGCGEDGTRAYAHDTGVRTRMRLFPASAT